MSGIVGVMRKDGKPVTSLTLAPLYQAMTLWGPDGYRTWHKGSVGFGHLQLWVTPESRYDHQPISFSSDSGLVITADARIDNRASLLDQIGVPQEVCATLPDSEVILRAYERWGADCIEKLVGAFAFAIWDAWNHTLFCGRDHIGFRPFFYADTPRFFVFASDIKGVLAYPPVPLNLYEPLLAARLQHTTYQAEKQFTFYEGVVKLPPAHRLIISKGKVRLDRYWRPEDVPDVRFSTEDAYAERLREILEQAIRCRLRTTHPVGAHLSGGLDSSAVTALAARQLRGASQSLDAFSWSPLPESGAPLVDERADVEAVRHQAGIPCHYHTLTHDDAIQIYSRDFTLEPTEMLVYERWVQEQAAQSGIRVMLSGWGGDEVASAHTRCYLSELLTTGRWCIMHRELKAALGSRGKVSPWIRAKRYGRTLLYSGIAPLLPNGLYQHIHRGTVNSPRLKSCVNPAFARRYRHEVRALRDRGCRERPRIRTLQIHRLTLGHLTQRIEAWAINGARRGLTYGYPLLDRRLLEFCLGLPVDCFFHEGKGRTIFRQALQGALPDTVRLKTSKREPANTEIAMRIGPGGPGAPRRPLRGGSCRGDCAACSNAPAHGDPIHQQLHTSTCLA